MPVLQVTNTVLVSVDKDEKQALELLQQHQSGQQPAVRAIDAKPTTQTQANSAETGIAAMWWQYGAKLDLSERRLNYADLHGSLLPRTQLVNAWLKNVNLNKVQLQGAYLGGAQLQGARCDYTRTLLSITDKTDLSLCQLQDWQLTQQSDLEALLAKL